MKNQADLTIFSHDQLISQDTSVLHSHIRRSISTKNKNHNNSASKWISAELQCVHDEWADDNHHMILQVTITIWYVKNHFMIFIMINKIWLYFFGTLWIYFVNHILQWWRDEYQFLSFPDGIGNSLDYGYVVCRTLYFYF